MTNTLTAARKADRAEMAGIVYDMATQAGFDACIQHDPSNRIDRVLLTFAFGLRVLVTFTAAMPDTYVLSWHGLDDGFRLNPDAFSSVNPYHGHKATDVARGFGHLTDVLAVRFASIADGSAFLDRL